MHMYTTKQGKGKNKIHPRTSYLGPKGEQKYSATLSLTSALDGGGWSTPCPSCFTSRNETLPIAQEIWWAPGPVWMGVENLVPTGIQSPDHQAIVSCSITYLSPQRFKGTVRISQTLGIRTQYTAKYTSSQFLQLFNNIYSKMYQLKRK